MNLEPYILNDIDMCSVNDTVGKLQRVFQQFPHSHIPIEKGGIYLGSVSKEDINSFEEQKTIGEYQYALENFYVRDQENWLDILQTFAARQTDMLPVLDDANNYQGFVLLNDIVSLLTDTPFMTGPGGVLIVEKAYKDYSFSEICQIVESNDSNVQGMFLSKLENDLAQVTLKIGQTGINSILQAFRRYGYNIISHHDEDTFKSNLQERSKYLDKYLNV